VALLVLTTIREPRWAIAYLLLFGWAQSRRHGGDHDDAWAVPFACTGIRFARFNRGLTMALGVDQRGLRAVHHLPDWLRGRAVHLASLLNAPLKPVREGQATLHSWGMEFA